MPRQYIYSDVDRFLTLEDDGNIKIHYDKDAVIQSVRNILSTVSGERVRSPLGSSLVRMLFEPVNVDTAESIRGLLQRDLQRWEPRIEVMDVIVTPNPDMGRFDVDMNLRVRKIQRRINFQTALRSLNF